MNRQQKSSLKRKTKITNRQNERKMSIMPSSSSSSSSDNSIEKNRFKDVAKKHVNFYINDLVQTTVNKMSVIKNKSEYERFEDEDDEYEKINSSSEEEEAFAINSNGKQANKESEIKSQQKNVDSFSLQKKSDRLYSLPNFSNSHDTKNMLNETDELKKQKTTVSINKSNFYSTITLEGLGNQVNSKLRSKSVITNNSTSDYHIDISSETLNNDSEKDSNIFSYCFNFFGFRSKLKLNNQNVDTQSNEEKVSKKTGCSYWCKKICNNSRYTRVSFYRNNMSFFIIIICYILLSIVLSCIQYYLYGDKNPAVKIARIGGILLDFNSCLIILLVMRRLVTWLRNSVIGRYLPTDDFLKFHKFLGVFILVLSLIHTIAHCVNLYWLSREYKSTLPQSQRLIQISRGFELYDTSTEIPFDNNATGLLEAIVKKHKKTTKPTTATTSTFRYVEAPSYADLLFTTASKVGWVRGTAMPTGWALLILLAVIEIFSMSIIRRKGFFQVFYVTHWLHIVYYILLIIHCKNFWKWFVFPFVLVVFERIYTVIRVRSAKHGETYIRDVNLLSSKVTQLIITRPPNFKFKSGDYLYIKIPSIAKFEWHPFTISSAPEKKDELWLHVRTLGNWTNKLYEHFRDYSKKERSNSIFDSAGIRNMGLETKYERKMSNLVVMTKYKKKHLTDFIENEKGLKKKASQIADSADDIKKVEINLNISNNIRNIWEDIQIDGPYSTSSRRIFDSEQVILIAGGIGVTPFASILQSLWFKYSKSLKTCSNCNHQWYDELDQKKLKRVDFIWVNRDYQSFEWFIELLGQLELQQLNASQTRTDAERFIGIHLYMTSAKMVQEIKPLENPEFDKEGQIESKIEDFSLTLHPGRPDFDKIFSQIYATRKGKVDVFFCGNRNFGREVHRKSIAYKFKFNKEHF